MMEGGSGIRCPQCNYQFPTIFCESCGSENLRESLYCSRCGKEVGGKEVGGKEVGEKEVGEKETSIDWEDRKLCSDGECIGVINEQGVCKVCGKPYTGEPE
jgi:DNA-directed RNA polymerase subunit RPC12/RpoP